MSIFGSFSAGPRNGSGEQRNFGGTGYLANSLPSGGGGGGGDGLEQVRRMLGGDVSLAELQSVFGAMSTLELTELLTQGGVPKLRSIIEERRAAAKGVGGGSGKDLNGVATKIVESLVGNQLGSSGSSLFREMVDKVRRLLDSNFSGGDGQLLSGLLGAKTDPVALMQLLDGAKAASADKEAVTLATAPVTQAAAPPSGAQMTMSVTLGIEKDRTQRHAGLGLSFAGLGSEWEYSKVGSGLASDMELLVESCAELVMYLAGKAEALRREGTRVVMVYLVASPAELAKVQALTEGEWGRFVAQRLGGLPFPRINWIAVPRAETESGLAVARAALTRKLGDAPAAATLVGMGAAVGAPKPLFSEFARGQPEKKGEITCRKCQKTGHIARNCTNEEVCFKCNKPGHKAAECKEKSDSKYDLKYREFTCRKCQQLGHIARDCKEPAVAAPPKPAREPIGALFERATRRVEPCMLCESLDHASPRCPLLLDTGARLAELRDELAFNRQMEMVVPCCGACGDTSHGDVDCPVLASQQLAMMDMNMGLGGRRMGGPWTNEAPMRDNGPRQMMRGGPGFGGPMGPPATNKTCRNCNLPGHLARNCERSFPDITCRRCSKTGHYAKDCAMPRDGDVNGEPMGRRGPMRGGSMRGGGGPMRRRF